ncbi:MAG: DUF58 domain-containing protein [Micromonosporaceae bacterium]|nr:DUF58 domain-containing protein [Micromonosporaceae bacterium]
MRHAFSGLTTRGRSFLAAAAAAGLSALFLGEQDLLRVAVLLVAVPLLAVIAVAGSRYRLTCSRVLQPRRVPMGSAARVVLRLQNTTGFPTGTLLLEDRLPYALGSRPRLVLERLGARHSSSVAYAVRAESRGRYEIGPLRVRLTDPFGLCELVRSFPAVSQLTVIPQVHPLPAIRIAGEYAGAGESRTRSVAVHGEDDAATREYRHGDDLRRVHWRSTARVGELMVRREEQPWESRATVVLDPRLTAHRGEGPASSFEWAVSAVASIAVHLRHGGYKLRLVTDAQAAADFTDLDESGLGAVLDHLAEVRPDPDLQIGALVDQVRQHDQGGLVVAVLGLMTEQEAKVTAGLHTASGTCVGFLIDSTTWLHLPDGARQRASRNHELSRLTLLRRGWRVIPTGHGQALSTLWHQAGARGAQGFAYRAPMAETVSRAGT